MSIKELAYAKVNLTLQVLDKRPDGMHNLKSIMAPIDLSDQLSFELIEDSNEIIVESSIDIEDNIVLKTALLFQQIYNVNKGAKIKITKNIPIAAGLAGGSADCAATLRGLNQLWELYRPMEKLAQISLMLGSDTAFCIYNKLALVLGRGNKIKILSKKLPEHIIVINPKFPVKTKEVFENLLPTDHSKINDLECVTFRLYPKLKALKDELNEFSKLSFNMTGSGPTLYAVSSDETILEEIKKKYQKKNFVYVGKFLK